MHRGDPVIGCAGWLPQLTGSTQLSGAAAHNVARAPTLNNLKVIELALIWQIAG
jgi:hypothetical protein